MPKAIFGEEMIKLLKEKRMKKEEEAIEKERRKVERETKKKQKQQERERKQAEVERRREESRVVAEPDVCDIVRCSKFEDVLRKKMHKLLGVILVKGGFTVIAQSLGS